MTTTASPTGTLSGALARRFHFGDPTVTAPPLPAGWLPAALAGFRGVRARPGWPLVVEPGAGREAFARPLGTALAEFARATGDPRLAEPLARLEEGLDAKLATGEPQALAPTLAAAADRVAEQTDLPVEVRDVFTAQVATFAGLSSPEALLVGWGPAAPWRLADLAARRRLATLRPDAKRALTALAAEADGLLAADDERRRGDAAPAGRESRLGALGGRFVDPGRLAEVVSHRRGAPPMSEERRAALVVARDRLRTAVEDAVEPLWVASTSADDLPKGLRARRADDACAEASRRFDAAAARVAEVARAARRVRLEIAGELDEAVHGPGLERLDWREFDAEELALVPPVFAVVRPLDLLAGGAQSLMRLFLSGRPIQVIVPTGGDDEAAALATFDPVSLGLGHRSVVVHRGTPGRPERLVEGLARALAGGRPALHVIDLPDPVEGLDPWVVAAARVAGRATPLLFHDPTGGDGWSRRLRIDGNPAPRSDWPADPVGAVAEVEGNGISGFTFADAALLDPAWRRHFAPVADDAAWTPIGEWLGLPHDRASHRLPGVEAIDPEGATRRLAVSRSLALAARRRRDDWRSLEELAGVRSERLDEAAESVRRELAESSAKEREALEAKHAAELDRLRAEASAAAVGRIVAGLMGEAPLSLADLAIAAPSSPAPSAASTAAAETPAHSEAPSAAPPVASDVWVDSALCTSCDECVRKYPAVFVYNADKQATVKDPRGGSFRDLVRAAEACPARVIHPGEPWDAGEKDLAAWVERARKFD